MKRRTNLYHRIPRWENLTEAFRKAARGKRANPEVHRFESNLEQNLLKIQMDFLSGKPDIGNYRFFKVHDPKPRNICAASFAERVLHHAVMNVCEPVLDSYAIYDTYACRKGKGQHKALLRAQTFMRCHQWYLKLDIRKYFDSIDHFIAIRLLSRRFKEGELILLFDRILDTYHTTPGKGVPIGNLISQHLGNFYLAPFDHWVKEELRIKGYLRYMDDFVFFADTKKELKALFPQIESFLQEKLALEIKHSRQLNKSGFGLPFLGYRVYPTAIRLTPRSRRRFVKKYIRYQKNWVEGRWSENELVRRVEPLFAFAMVADTSNFRKNVLKRFGVPC